MLSFLLGATRMERMRTEDIRGLLDVLEMWIHQKKDPEVGKWPRRFMDVVSEDVKLVGVRTLRIGGYYMEVDDWLWWWWRGRGLKDFQPSVEQQLRQVITFFFLFFFCQETHFKNKTHAGSDWECGHMVVGDACLSDSQETQLQTSVFL